MYIFECKEREIYWIKTLSATNKNIGYNISKGGFYIGIKNLENNHFYGKSHSYESKLKISNSKKGKSPWNKGLNINDERVKTYINKSSITKKGMFNGEKNPMYNKRGKNHPSFGTKRNKEQIEKMKKSKIGSLNPMSKICEIITPNGEVFITTVNEWFRLYGEHYQVTKSFLRGIANGIVKNNKKWICKYI